MILRAAGSTYAWTNLRGKVAAAGLGLALFLFMGGLAALVPTNIGWLTTADPITHWLGWEYFRLAPLRQWPLGANPLYGEGLNNTIVYTDSIPLLAFLFKPFEALLPSTFQYTGGWLALCFMLQGLFAFRILYRLTSAPLASLVASAFFIIAPPFLLRVPGHFALAGHWILLAGLWLYLASNFRARGWGLLAIVASLVHGYLLVMLLSVWTADIAQRLLKKELGVRQAALIAVTTLALLVLCMWAAGYFAVSSPGTGGFGIYRLNVLSPIDPDDLFSRLLRNQPGGIGDYEGLAFLGLGPILLGVLLAATAPMSCVRGVFSLRFDPSVVPRHRPHHIRDLELGRNRRPGVAGLPFTGLCPPADRNLQGLRTLLLAGLLLDPDPDLGRSDPGCGSRGGRSRYWP